MLKKLVLLFLFLFPSILFAQSALTGNIYDNNNRSTPLEGASVKNLTSKSLSLADKDGHFAIAAKNGDLIAIGMVGYETDTIYLVNLFPKNIYLRVQVNNLNTVNITGAKISPFLDVRDPNARPARQVEFSKERGGVSLTLGYNKFKRQQAKIQQLEEDNIYIEEINKNFTEQFIKNLLKFEGPDVKNFMQLFRPSILQVKAERPFNYAFYTAKAYREWLKLPADQRKLPTLLKPKVNE